MSYPFILLSLFFRLATALLNVSLDDTDSSITYRPQRGSWESGLKSGLDFGGSHSVSSDPASNATLHFTGVAVYYLAPRWPYSVSTVITLDGGQSDFVNLTDLNATPTPPGGSESAEFSVAWSATGLRNTSHSLLLTMSPVAANGGVIISDGFIYTVDNGSSAPATSSSARTSSSSLVAASPSPSISVTSNSSNATAIGVGTALGASALLAALLTVFCILRRRSRTNKQQNPTNLLDEWDEEPHPPAPTPFVAQPASVHVPTMSDASTGPLLPATWDPYRDIPHPATRSTVFSHGAPTSEFGTSNGTGWYLPPPGARPAERESEEDPDDADRELASGGRGISRPSNTTPPARREKSQPLRVQTYSPAPPAYSESEQG